MNLSFITKSFTLTVVVVPLTVKSPPIIVSPPIVVSPATVTFSLTVILSTVISSANCITFAAVITIPSPCVYVVPPLPPVWSTHAKLFASDQPSTLAVVGVPVTVISLGVIVSKAANAPESVISESKCV